MLTGPANYGLDDLRMQRGPYGSANYGLDDLRMPQRVSKLAVCTTWRMHPIYLPRWQTSGLHDLAHATTPWHGKLRSGRPANAGNLRSGRPAEAPMLTAPANYGQDDLRMQKGPHGPANYDLDDLRMPAN